MSSHEYEKQGYKKKAFIKIDSQECPTTLRDCTFKVLLRLEMPKKDSFLTRS